MCSISVKLKNDEKFTFFNFSFTFHAHKYKLCCCPVFFCSSLGITQKENEDESEDPKMLFSSFFFTLIYIQEKAKIYFHSHTLLADCVHLQFYKNSAERYKNGPTKASLSLQHFLGIETGFTFDKESNTIAILCEDIIVIMAFDTREVLMQWQVKIASNLGDDIQYLVLVASATTKSKIAPGPARLHIQNQRFCITTGIPPRLSGIWHFNHLRY